MRVGGAGVAGLAGLVALGGLVAACGGGGDPRGDTIDTSNATTTTVAVTHTTVQSVNDAVPIVQGLLTVKLADNDIRLLVVDLCAAASTGNHGTITEDLEALKLTTDNDLKATITALGRGAEAYCPDGVQMAPNLLNDLHAAVLPTLSAATTSTTTAT